MADPITLAIASFGMQALGSIQQSRAASSAAKANATIAEQNAAQIQSQTVAAEEKQRREGLLRAGAARAVAGSRGLGIDSAADILSDNAAQEELDILTLRHSGLLQQRGQLQTAALERSQAKQIKKALPWQIGTQALSSYGSFKQASN